MSAHLARSQITRDLAIAFVSSQPLIVWKISLLPRGFIADIYAVKETTGGKSTIIMTDRDRFNLT